MGPIYHLRSVDQGDRSVSRSHALPLYAFTSMHRLDSGGRSIQPPSNVYGQIDNQKWISQQTPIES